MQPLPDASPQPGNVGLAYIASRAGISRRSRNYQLNYVRLCHANEGFPPPLPRFNMSKGTTLGGISLQSRWLREPVDAWFDGFLPPHLVTVIEDRRAAEDAGRLDQRARQMAA